ncbi:transforming growth factor beta activator LRRC32-like [Lissotriton helveticus]
MCLLPATLSQPPPRLPLFPWFQFLLLGVSAGIYLQPSTAPRAGCQQNRTKVICRGQNLHHLPHDLRTNVKTLDISHNFVQTLSAKAMGTLHALEHLTLSYNNLVTIEAEAFRAAPQLQSLTLASNFLDREHLSNSLAFRSLRSLKALDLSANNLDSEMVASYLANTTSLKELNLSWNKMPKLSFELFRGAPHLRIINLTSCLVLEIEVGTFESLTELRELILAKNHLRCIASFNLPQLRVLNLSSNALEIFVAGETEEDHELQVLDLSHNRLHHFPALPIAHRIQHLNLSGNRMGSLVPKPAEGEELSDTTLWYDDTSWHDLSYMMLSRAALSSLTHLDLSWNRLTSFPIYFLHNLNRLQILNMAMNCLQDLPPDSRAGSMSLRGDVKQLAWYMLKLESLSNLNLRGNDIQVVPRQLLEVTPKLEIMDLAQNSIMLCFDANTERNYHSCTSLSGLTSLKHLSLRANGMRMVPPHTFTGTALNSLDLSENEGLVLSRDSLMGLELSIQTLSLRGNQLHSSDIDIPCLKALLVLDLSANQMDFLPPSLECTPVVRLDVRNNRLELFQHQVAKSLAGTLVSLFISGNPLKCCHLAWLERLQAAKVNVIDLAQVECVPDRLSGVTLVRVDSNPMGFCPHPVGPGYLLAAILVPLVLLCGMAIYLKKGRSSKSLSFRGHRVASTSYQPSTEKKVEGAPADRMTTL